VGKTSNDPCPTAAALDSLQTEKSYGSKTSSKKKKRTFTGAVLSKKGERDTWGREDKEDGSANT